ncbi:MAG: metallophosphoesterase [Gemmatimonadota bacterium]|nr:metallophosphoesterase [Gemmatimonadota bacterium]
MLYFGLYLLVTWSAIAALTWSLFPGAPLVVALIAVCSAAPIFIFVTRRSWPFYPSALFRLFVIRPVLYVQLLLPLVTAAGIVGASIGIPFGAPLYIARLLAGNLFLVCVLLLGLGLFGSRMLVVRDVEAFIENLPAEFDGKRIAQLSDLHVGPQTSKSFLQRVANTVQLLQPDIIAVTGDLIDDRPEDVSDYALSLGQMNAPLGVFMIPGNHDVYAGWNAVNGALGAAIQGRILVNESQVIHVGSAAVAIVGLGDPAGGLRGLGANVAPDIEKSFRDVPANTVVIALAHNPGLWVALQQRGAALTLSGHTHWGQFSIPALNWSIASPWLKHAMGAYGEGRSLLYISPGTGFWGVPFRIGAWPEITNITLRQGEAPSIVVGKTVRAARLLRKQNG